MHDYQRYFIELTLQRGVLRFGDFTLKSGRQSPYFFNMGRIDSGAALAQLGFDYSYTGNATHAWLTVLVMDVWHWTPLVALLCYAGLRAIPDAYYQAASIDGASKLAVCQNRGSCSVTVV